MTGVSGINENSATGLMNIVGMLSYPVGQSFRKSLRDYTTSLCETVFN